MRKLLLILSLNIGIRSYSQVNTNFPINILPQHLLFNSAQIIQTDSGLSIIQITRSGCKDYLSDSYFFSNPTVIVLPEKLIVPELAVKHEKFITVHGNVYYDYSYRSYIDTPFAQSDVQQHFIQTSLNFLVKDKYPVQISLAYRSSNSPYFKNGADINFQFNRKQLIDNIKSNLLARAGSYFNLRKPTTPELLYAMKLNEVRQLQEWINSPARMQEMVEDKEKEFEKKNQKVSLQTAERSKVLDRTGGIDDETKVKSISEMKLPGSFGNNFLKKVKNEAVDSKDTAESGLKKAINDSSLGKKLNEKKAQLEKLEKELRQYETKAVQSRKNIQDSVNRVKGEISSLNNPEGLYAFMKHHGIAKNELTKAQRLLLAVKKIGIGRNWLDYSELTVKNVSLSGVNMELNPSPFYFAAAAGKINYRFRDFVLKNNSNNLPDQSLYLLRAGVGQKDKNNFILTFYDGKKALLNYTASALNNGIQQVLGISAETRLAINDNNYIIAEVAKSSYNKNTGTQPSSSELLKKAFNLKVHTNVAYSVKLYTRIEQTDTRISGYYKKLGEDFQSFNLFPININQDAWMAKVNQYFWKRKFSLEAAIRKNDFVSPIASPSFASKTIFKSVQASLRIPKYPFISVGFYPTSQLTVAANNLLVENQYNTFNAIISHSYRVKKAAFSTNAVFTRFYNNSSDTGFIYYNATSYAVNNSVFLNPLTLLSSISLTDQKDLHVFTVEQSLSYQFKNRLTLSGGLKWNRLNKEEDLFGATAGLGIYLKKLGTIRGNYDRAYLPGYNRILMPVDIGRVSFYREF